MKINVTHDNGYILAELQGVIDESGEPLMREVLHPLVRPRGTKLVLDLSHAQRIDSQGIGLLVRLVSDANTNGSRVVMAAATPFVRTIFEVTKLNRFFELADSISLALEQLGVEA